MTRTTIFRALLPIAIGFAGTIAQAFAQAAPRPVLSAAPLPATVPSPTVVSSTAPISPFNGAKPLALPRQATSPPALPRTNESPRPDVPPLTPGGLAPTSDGSAAIAPMFGRVPLSDVLREADVRNPDLIAARSLIVSEQARVAQAARAPLQLVVQPAIAEDVPGGVGRLQQFAAGFSQQVSPGTKLARAVATYDVTLARGLAEATSRDVRSRIVEGYYALAATQARIVAAEQNVRSAKDLVNIVRFRKRAGAVGGFEVLRVTVELRRAQSELGQARSSVRQNAITLGALVGRAVDPAATLPIDVQPGVETTLDAAKTVERALTRDPTTAQLRATLARSSAQLDAARAQRRPALSVAAGYLLQRAPMSASRTSGGVTASLGVSFPIVDFGTIRGAELEARANATTAHAQIAGRELQLRASIAAAREAIESSRLRLEFAGESLRRADKGSQIAQFGFRQGALGTLDIIAARTAATAARTERDQARGDYAAAVAKLRILLGDSIAP